MPLVLTQTRTLVQTNNPVTIVPSRIISADTVGFSRSIVAAASSPRAPTSSGHESLPANYNYKLLQITAKQAWRLLINPNSLAARVLKAKYFPNCDFVQVPGKQGVSHAWRSILWGRELLNKGLVWQVGNGKDIDVFKDPWIPRPKSFKVVSPPNNASLMVADLILQDSYQWNHRKLNEVLLPVDREQVLSIPLSCRNNCDRRSWFYDKKGVYSVKSGYRVALDTSLASDSASCSAPALHRWWMVLWNLNMPPKVKIFSWRACLKALPTKENLARRNILTECGCEGCNGAVETDIHALFKCRIAKQSWLSYEKGRRLLNMKLDSVLSVLLGALQIGGVNCVAEVCMILWCIWANRNARRQCAGAGLEEEVSKRALEMLLEFQKTRSALSPSPSAGAPPCAQVWCPPPAGVLKLNSDAAVRPGSRVVGLGFAVRDSAGFVVLASAKQWHGMFSPEIGELVALREGLRSALSSGLRVQLVEVDSVNVASVINSSEICRGASSFLIDDIKVLCIELGVSRCLAIPREGNRLAHNLASIALSSSEELCWQNVDLGCIFPSGGCV